MYFKQTRQFHFSIFGEVFLCQNERIRSLFNQLLRTDLLIPKGMVSREVFHYILKVKGVATLRIELGITF